MTFSRTLSVSVVAGVIGLAVAFGPTLRADDGVIVRYTATAIDTNGVGSSWVAPVEINLIRWSTDQDRKHLLDVLRSEGPDDLLDALIDTPRVGFFRASTSIGYDLHYAQHHVLPDGSEDVMLLTDRAIAFWEIVNRPRSYYYPFTVFTFHLDADGKGDGHISAATQISSDPDARFLVAESYGIQPMLLRSVRRKAP